MFFVESASDRSHLRIGGDRVQGHRRDFFQYHRVVGRSVWRGTPAEGRVACDEDRRGVQRIPLAHALHDGEPSIYLVRVTNLRWAERFCYWNAAVKIICVGSAETGDFALALRPRRGRPRVGVSDAADGLEILVQKQM